MERIREFLSVSHCPCKRGGSLYFSRVSLERARTPLAWARALCAGALLAALATLLGACAGAAGDAGDNGGVGGSGGRAGSGGIPALGPTLSFPDPDPLSLERGKTATLEVLAEPAGIYTVRFALLPGPEGTSPGDAALSATDLMTDAGGVVAVELTAPTAPTTFAVRASATGSMPVQRLVQVQKTGKADLRVVAEYSGGREVTRWYATAQANQTCASLPDEPLNDNFDWTASSTNEPIDHVDLLDVVADTPLAVLLRAEHYAWGCVTLPGVTEGVDNRVQVPVTNVPIQLASSEISVSFDFDGYAGALLAALEPTRVAVLDGLVGSREDDVEALLDAMHEASTGDQTSFASARTAERWDAVLRTEIGSSAPRFLRDPLDRWLTAGLDRVSAGTLVGTLASTGTAPDGAELTLASVAGLDPTGLGFDTKNATTWYAASSPADGVFFGTTLAFAASRLVVGAAEPPALDEQPAVKDLAGALAAALPCSAVADALTAHGQALGESYAGCDATCTEALCGVALDAIVLDLAGLSGSSRAKLDLAGAADARVGSEAEVVALDGTWVGDLAIDSDAASLGGLVVAPAP